ncbi:phospho-acceptor domain-containing protein [Roseibium hamelinense]|uniref:histidine kinase n=1 Tax=Roseibium hamelinense TaxID=150831 RepID=A0A562T9Y4_9HYPH|nr:HAMP domain-containing sensor histidine kinase [Roseibium hamelinense]MTI43566.1 HAMP domain-containing protein [Roseibium hamelinense]TWI89640.1 phospho-acceptor domain-containing protein [Roseibium hamelinense]
MSLRAELQALWRSSALRQALVLSLLFVGILVAAGFLAQNLLREELQDRVEDDLYLRLEFLAGQIDQLMEYDVEDENEKGGLDSDARADIRQLVRVPVSEVDDRVFIDAFRPDGGDVIGALPASAFDQQGLHSERFRLAPNEDRESWTVLSEDVTGGRIAVAHRGAATDEFLELLPGAFLYTGGAAVLLTLVAGTAFGLVARRRFHRISQSLDRLSEGDLTSRVGRLSGRDDLSDLARHIDATAERLDILLRQTRDLATSIAHDLKTPVTRLRARLENLSVELEDGRQAEEADKALAEIDRIILTFESLLQIARMDAGAHRGRFQDIRLADLVREIAEAYQPVIEDSGYRFQLDATPGSAMIRGEAGLLKRALANLIENALRHGGGGGTIRLFSRDKTIGLSDEGPGIAEAERQHVLEPFVRLDTSRTGEGVGLGLAFVQSVAKLHDASLYLSDTRQETPVGLTVTLGFNAASQNLTNL